MQRQSWIQEWWLSIPPVTRWWLTIALVLSVGMKAGFLNPMLFTLDWTKTWSKFQIWRPISAMVFFGAPSFNLVMQLYMLYNFGSTLERSPFPSGGGSRNGSIADYVFHLGIGGAVLMFITWISGFGYLLLGPAMLIFVIYLWSKRFPSAPGRFWMFNVPGAYLPWVLVGFSFLVEPNPPILELLGIAAAHLLYMVLEIFPQQGWPRLKTPMFLSNLFKVQPTDEAAALVHERMRNQAPMQRGYNWGTGRVLGREHHD